MESSRPGSARSQDKSNLSTHEAVCQLSSKSTISSKGISQLSSQIIKLKLQYPARPYSVIQPGSAVAKSKNNFNV